MIDGIQPPRRSGEAKRPAKIVREDDIPEPAFQPPESYDAAVEEIELPAEEEKSAVNTKPPKSKKDMFNPIEWFQDLQGKQKALVIGVTVIVLGALGGGAWALFGKSDPAPAPTPVVEQKKEEPPKATPIYSPLTGMTVTKEQSELPVIGIMIENSPDARPQSGLNTAGVVFEAIAEGGITRFLALYQEAQPDYVGPVRSVRPYYVDWLQGFDAAVAHVGGSPEALAKIKADGVKDLDQFYNPRPYNRVRTRYAPHNMYTSLAGLLDLTKQKGWATSKFTGFPRKAEKPSAAPTARVIDTTISGALYNIHYDYDLASNSYKRVLAGKAHLDERSKAQISPKVVIVMVVPYSIHGDGVHSVYKTIGSGRAFIFQDGEVVDGIWEKSSSKAQIIFKNAAGKVVELNAGQTWITATSIATNVSYRP